MSVPSIVIVGGGWEAWLAAALLATLLRGNHAITVVGREAPSLMPVVPTTPAARDVHRLLKLDQAALARVATPRFGMAVEANGRRFVVPFGRFGDPALPGAFAELWWRLGASGRALPLEAYSATARLAERGGTLPTGPLGATADYGVHFLADGYAALLRDVARGRAVAWRDADLAGVERRADGTVSMLTLDNGERLAATWFIDASADRALVGDADWLAGPERYLSFSPCEPGGVAPALSRLTRTDGGWRWTMPVPGGAISGRLSDAPVPGAILWRSGRLARAWRANTLAMGPAESVLDPLEPLTLERVQRAVARFVTLLPTPETLPVIAREYDRQLASERGAMASASQAVTSLVIDGGPRAGLDGAVQLFLRSGRLPAHEADPFTPDTWLALFTGVGLTPARYDPNADRLDLDQTAAAFERWAGLVAAL